MHRLKKEKNHLQAKNEGVHPQSIKNSIGTMPQIISYDENHKISSQELPSCNMKGVAQCTIEEFIPTKMGIVCMLVCIKMSKLPKMIWHSCVFNHKARYVILICIHFTMSLARSQMSIQYFLHKVTISQSCLRNYDEYM